MHEPIAARIDGRRVRIRAALQAAPTTTIYHLRFALWLALAIRIGPHVVVTGFAELTASLDAKSTAGSASGEPHLDF
ncbi:MAG: hypothetical protein ACK4N1_06400 [Pseudorhizobium sp.]